MNNDQKKKALIAGASGISGSYIAQELLSRPDWQVMGLARTIPRGDSDDDMVFLAADMLEPSSLAQVSGYFSDLTHTYRGINVSTFPLGVSLVASYIHKNFGDELEVRVFKLPEILPCTLRCLPININLMLVLWSPLALRNKH